MQQISFQLPHIKLAGLAFGDPDKPLIVALHGWLDNAASFVPLADYLQDYYLVAIDFAGHGLSQHRSADAHYHLLDFVHDLHELVLTQGWSNFILLGHSMGGIVGSLYTSSFPEFVSHYITMESFGPMTKTEASSAEQLRESIESRIKIRDREPRHPENLETVVRARAQAGDLAQTSATLLVQRNLCEKNEQLYWLTDRRLRAISSLRVTEGQAKAFMQSISCPVLAIEGLTGFDMMKARMQERRAWITHLKSAICEGGHHLHMDNPQPVAAEIVAFLQKN
jgi:pimeloyl-ACP methyl ester carboxylesterase